MLERYSSPNIVGRRLVDIFASDVTLAGLVKSMQAQSMRKGLVAQNIANVNTPGYQRRDVAFAGQLAEALSDKSGSRSDRASRVMGTSAQEVVEDDLFFRNDLNGVDLDREMVEHAKANIMGSTISQLIAKKIRMYRMVIKDGRI